MRGCLFYIISFIFLIFPGWFTFLLFHSRNPIEFVLAFFCEDIDGFVQGDVAMLQLSANVTMVEHYDTTLPKTNMARLKILILNRKNHLHSWWIFHCHDSFCIFCFGRNFLSVRFGSVFQVFFLKQEVDRHGYWMMNLHWFFHQLWSVQIFIHSWSLFLFFFPTTD